MEGGREAASVAPLRNNSGHFSPKIVERSRREFGTRRNFVSRYVAPKKCGLAAGNGVAAAPLSNPRWPNLAMTSTTTTPFSSRRARPP